MNKTMIEKQYEALLETEKQHGRTRLGLMTNQVWHDDPKRLGIILARYKFVSKMLHGRDRVAEIGCGDGFGSRIVAREVGDDIVLYDIDPTFVNEINSTGSYAIVHDITAEPLPIKYDAIYALDLIEHISPYSEMRFMDNIFYSLNDHGVLIIGTPSLESQAYASPQSKAGHINCYSGEKLRGLMAAYFHSVFMFGMNDETLTTGHFGMCHYLFAIGADPRRSTSARVLKERQ